MVLVLPACDPYAEWPAAESYFPHVYTPEVNLPDYADARWETETWTPEDNPEQLAQYIQKSAFHRTSAPAESLAHFELMGQKIPPLTDGTTVSFVGDVMWLGENWSEFAAPAADLLHGDIRAGNLETPTDPTQSTDESALGTYAFNAPTAIYESLPLDVLQLNNNHTLDAGNSGISQTLAEAEARGFLQTGIDHHAEQASVAFLSYTWGLNVRDEQFDFELFIVPFGHVDDEISLDQIGTDIASARSNGAQSVVLMLHWGFEYEYYPDPHFMILARELITLGADLIVGSGPHVVQPAEICAVNQPEFVPGVGTCSIRTDDGEPRTAAVLYSLGNFGTKMATTQCQAGLVATVSLNPDVSGLGWAGAVTVDGEKGREIQPMDTLLGDSEWATESARLDAHLGASWRDSASR